MISNKHWLMLNRREKYLMLLGMAFSKRLSK